MEVAGIFGCGQTTAGDIGRKSLVSWVGETRGKMGRAGLSGMGAIRVTCSEGGLSITTVLEGGRFAHPVPSVMGTTVSFGFAMIPCALYRISVFI